MSNIDMFGYFVSAFCFFMFFIGLPIIVHERVIFRNDNLYEYLLMNQDNFARSNSKLSFYIPMPRHGFIMRPYFLGKLLFPYAIADNDVQGIKSCLIFRGTKLHKVIKQIDKKAIKNYSDKYMEIIENCYRAKCEDYNE